MWFEAKIESLPTILRYISDQAARASLSSEASYKLELACEEAVVNIISYASAEVIDISCEKRGTRFQVTIKDHGKPFNPIESEVDLQQEVPLQDREIGGIGLFLMRQLMDETSYQRVGNENILRMAIRI